MPERLAILPSATAPPVRNREERENERFLEFVSPALSCPFFGQPSLPFAALRQSCAETGKKILVCACAVQQNTNKNAVVLQLVNRTVLLCAPPCNCGLAEEEAPSHPAGLNRARRGAGDGSGGHALPMYVI
ncbi:hypothetical protein C0Q70_00807 [Pomacea canaliculata]|uniref:Uncharacterized protein n=1 Tax=Pomacea canaliculata TaxID=400727 RepID=A0A2T7PXP2_POMCA|nr:hypothetical protein C0Q70_00807 [Pomacea canaliculata]